MSAIRCRGLVKTFGNVRALAGLDLDVPSGRIFGFLGPNGAGKTTTLHMLLGLLAPDAGSAEVLGMPVTAQAPAVRARCGVLLEHDGLLERLTAHENLVHHARLYGIAKDEAAARATQLLADAGWADRADPVSGWSRGMKRRLGVLRAFITRPALVFLDEPTSGFDPKVAAQLRAFLRTMADRHGTTVFLTTHDMREAEAMCDEVAILRAGTVVAQGSPGRLRDTTPTIRITGERFTARALAALRRRSEVRAVETWENGILVHLDRDMPASPIVASLVRAGAAVEAVERSRPSLEEDFLALMEASP